LWVIEGPKDILSEIPFDKTGLNIIVTDDLEMYRTRKVRILNGAHTAMIPYAMLEGIETVKDCMEDENMFAFVNKCVFEEIIPTLDLPESELVDYANNVFERFNNPFIKHLCSSISLNSVSKFKVRVLPSLLEYINRKGEMPKNLIFSLAKLIEFYKNGTPTDDAEIISYMKEHNLKDILANADFWGEDISFLYDEVAKV
jgi:tagaturonate reductase